MQFTGIIVSENGLRIIVVCEILFCFAPEIASPSRISTNDSDLFFIPT